jgi:hypothetical protein
MRFKYFRFITENYATTLKRKGVSDLVIKHVETLPNREKGKAISKLMANPKLTIDTLTDEDPKEGFRKRYPKEYNLISILKSSCTGISA